MSDAAERLKAIKDLLPGAGAHSPMLYIKACREIARLCDLPPAEPQDAMMNALTGRAANGFMYGEAMVAYWRVYAGAHSMLRCPGADACPGGCGANAADDMAAIQDARRGAASKDQLKRVARLRAFAKVGGAPPTGSAGTPG